MLRLNMAIPPATVGPSNLGLLGGDLAGFPNGRRVFDDVVTIELRCVAGATLRLVDKSFTPDAAATGGDPGPDQSPTDLTAKGTENYLSTSRTWVSPTAGSPPPEPSPNRHPARSVPSPGGGVGPVRRVRTRATPGTRR